MSGEADCRSRNASEALDARAPVHRRRTIRALLLALPLALALLLPSMAGAFSGVSVHTHATCQSVTIEYTNFPNANNNTVSQTVRIDGVLVYSGKFVFNGPSGTSVIPIHPLAGSHEIRTGAQWKTNGITGETGRHVEEITCAAEPKFSIEKRQEIGNGGYTTAELTGKIGQTVKYEIIVTNTGNTPLTFGPFEDEKCDAGTITGGPGTEPVAPGKSTTYFCTHVLNSVGPYTNSATDTGTPPPNDGPPITETSNTVITTVPAEPAFSIEKRQEIAGSGKGFTTSELAGNPGQTVDYEIIVTNTGNVPLTFGPFEDEKCDPGTITGGPGAEAVAPGKSTTYLCSHTLTEADKQAGIYTNNATDTGTPPPGEGEPVTNTSNTVVVEVPVPKAHVHTLSTCKSVTFTFTGFPNRPNNTVYETVKVDGTLVFAGKFTFNGTTGSNTIPLNLGPGPHEVRLNASWRTNGLVGETGRHVEVFTCPAEPGFSIEKLQEINGSGYTTSTIHGEAGQTVKYEIVVSNTGNVPLTFSEFTDERCDSGTITGGPGAEAVQPGKSTTYLCTHTLTAEDALAGSYSNSATDTGTPPAGDGNPQTNTSNTVVVELP